MGGLSYLAFAAGYRRVSFVLIEHGQLATWHTSCVAAREPAGAARFARDFIDLLDPDVIVMEDVAEGSLKGETALTLLEAIRKEAECSKAQLLLLKRELAFRTRRSEAEHLVRHYPDLADKVPKRKFCEREPHQMVLFEALAFAHQAKMGGAMLLASKM